jgi:ABC-2 type transport system permease protein
MASAVQSSVGSAPTLWGWLRGEILGTARLFYMSVWRNWLTLKQYKANFVFSFITGALFGVGMLLFALVFDIELLQRTVGTANYVSFAVLGVGYQSWQGVALWGASEMFRNELSTGQIDYTFTCPFSRYGYIISNVAALAVQETLFFVPMFAVGLWFTRETLSLGGLALGLLATALSVGVLVQLGAFFAALTLRYRQITAIFGFFNFAFQMLTGMFVPLQAMPPALRAVGLTILPQTYGMDLLRHYAMRTNTIVPVTQEWAVLLLQMVVCVALARISVQRLERAARDQGLHYI